MYDLFILCLCIQCTLKNYVLWKIFLKCINFKTKPTHFEKYKFFNFVSSKCIASHIHVVYIWMRIYFYFILLNNRKLCNSVEFILLHTLHLKSADAHNTWVLVSFYLKPCSHLNLCLPVILWISINQNCKIKYFAIWIMKID